MLPNVSYSNNEDTNKAISAPTREIRIDSVTKISP